MQLTSTTTSRAKPKLAAYRMFEPHDNHAGRSNAKIEVSIPNLPGLSAFTQMLAEYGRISDQVQYSKGSRR